MFQTIFNKGSLPLAEQTLYFTARRHDAIASNIANVETPKYKALDANEDDFREAMKRAIERRDRMPVPTFHMEGYRSVRPQVGGGLNVEFEEASSAGILSHTENNVDIDLEMGRMLKNAQKHNLAASVLAHQFALLREAIAERVTG